MSDQVYLMMSGFLDENGMKEYVLQHPEAREETERNLKTYGVPFLAGTIGWVKRSDVGKTVEDLLLNKMPSQLVELLVYARDGLGQEYAVQYDVLRHDGNEFLEKAVAYEERINNKEGDGNERK